MQRIAWLTASSILFAAAFWFPALLWWCIIFYPVGIIVAGARYGTPWYYGYIWGVVTFLLHSIGLLYGLIQYGDGPLLHRIIPHVGMTLYIGIYPAIIFGLANYIQQYYPRTIIRVLIWFAALLILTWAFHNMIFIIFGAWEGHPLLHPLIPIAQVPRLLSLLPLIGTQIYTICLFLLSSCIAYAILAPQPHHYMWILLATLPWLISYYVHSYEKPNTDIISHIAVIPIMFPLNVPDNELTDIVSNAMKMAHANAPETRTYIFPESAFHRSDINTFIPHWPMHHDNDRIIFGTFYTDDTDTCYNAMTIATRDHITQQHLKKHAMVLTEHIPYVFDVPWIRNQYCSKESSITPSTKPRKPIQVLDDLRCIPYICSELFMLNNPDDTHTLPALFIGNDMWLQYSPSQYTSTLMLQYARIRAMQWQQPIIYATYMHGYYISRSGDMEELQVFA